VSLFPYDTVVFDLDGTLFDSEQGILSSILHTMDTLGKPVPKELDMREMIGPPLLDSFIYKLHLSPELAGRAMALYRDVFSREGMYQYAVYPRIRAILQTLRQGGVFLAMATSKPITPTRTLLKYYGLLHFFNRIIGPEDTGPATDKPNLLRLALPERRGRAAMVGDRRYDMEAAVACKVDGIGAAYGFGSIDELCKAGATHIAPDTAALQTLLCGNAAPPRGFFLTVEGLDGSGKTTQTDRLKRSLLQYGFSVLRTREPGGCAISEEIRRLVLDTAYGEMCATCEALLYAAARAQHVSQCIRPAVERGMLVLCDRFVDSSLAFQGAGRKLGMDKVWQINEPAVDGMTPDATVYLAIDHKKALERRLNASSPDRLEAEDLDFHERAQWGYEQLIQKHPKRFLIVNAEQSEEAVAKDTLAMVLNRLDSEINLD